MQQEHPVRWMLLDCIVHRKCGGAGIRTPVRDSIHHSVYVRIPPIEVSIRWPVGGPRMNKLSKNSPGAGKRNTRLSRICDTLERGARKRSRWRERPGPRRRFHRLAKRGGPPLFSKSIRSASTRPTARATGAMAPCSRPEATLQPGLTSTSYSRRLDRSATGAARQLLHAEENRERCPPSG
jgi:hypothetical protein